MGVFGTITAGIAVNKGRYGVGWFFVGYFTGCIGLIVVLCMSDLEEEADRGRRRLREQLKQTRLNPDSSPRHVHKRLDVHDEALNVNTRQRTTDEDEHALLEQGSSDEELPPPEEAMPRPGTFNDHEWYVRIGKRTSRPLRLERLKSLYGRGMITEQNFIRTSKMSQWVPIEEVPGLLEELL